MVLDNTVSRAVNDNQVPLELYYLLAWILLVLLSPYNIWRGFAFFFGVIFFTNETSPIFMF